MNTTRKHLKNKNMPCKPLKPSTESISIDVELSFQYDRLKLIFNNNEEHDFMKGFKYAMDIVIEKYYKENLKSETIVTEYRDGSIDVETFKSEE
jgi:hypothetical protein